MKTVPLLYYNDAIPRTIVKENGKLELRPASQSLGLDIKINFLYNNFIAYFDSKFTASMKGHNKVILFK